jgi:hypothetical protein
MKTVTCREVAAKLQGIKDADAYLRGNALKEKFSIYCMLV